MAQECGKNTKQQQAAHTYIIHHTWHQHVPFFVLDMLSSRKVPRSLDQEERGMLGNVKLMQTAESSVCLCWGSFPAYYWISWVFMHKTST